MLLNRTAVGSQATLWVKWAEVLWMLGTVQYIHIKLLNVHIGHTYEIFTNMLLFHNLSQTSPQQSLDLAGFCTSLINGLAVANFCHLCVLAQWLLSLLLFTSLNLRNTTYCYYQHYKQENLNYMQQEPLMLMTAIQLRRSCSIDESRYVWKIWSGEAAVSWESLCNM